MSPTLPLISVPWIRTYAIPNTILILIGLFLCTRALIRRRSKLVIAGSAFGYLIASGFFVSTLVLMRLPAPQTAWTAGQTPPDFSLPNQDGREVSLSDYRGKGPVLLVFYRGFW
ncbi:MAG: redoxin domain-containing protein [Planctomycetes bacterium]|nr:redoxin domain-containing protein [Planctomycetota bacterium]